MFHGAELNLESEDESESESDSGEMFENSMESEPDVSADSHIESSVDQTSLPSTTNQPVAEFEADSSQKKMISPDVTEAEKGEGDVTEAEKRDSDVTESEKGDSDVTEKALKLSNDFDSVNEIKELKTNDEQEQDVATPAVKNSEETTSKIAISDDLDSTSTQTSVSLNRR